MVLSAAQVSDKGLAVKGTKILSSFQPPCCAKTPQPKAALVWKHVDWYNPGKRWRCMEPMNPRRFPPLILGVSTWDLLKGKHQPGVVSYKVSQTKTKGFMSADLAWEMCLSSVRNLGLHEEMQPARGRNNGGKTKPPSFLSCFTHQLKDNCVKQS